ATISLKTQDLQFFPTAEGFYDYTKDQYIYSYKDHLGNARVSFGKTSAGALEIVDSNDYYPFGMNHLKSGNSYFGTGSYKAYKYNGKELQETGMYDYGARMYMPDIGRWGVVDPLAETSRRWSTYAYAYNNPMRFIDPDGRQGTDWIKKDNQWTYDANIKTADQARAVGADAFAKNGSFISDARVDGNGDYGIVRLNEGGSIDKMENNLLNNGIAALNSINGMVENIVYEDFLSIRTDGPGRNDPDPGSWDKYKIGDKITPLNFDNFMKPSELPGESLAERFGALADGLDMLVDVAGMFGGESKNDSTYSVYNTWTIDKKGSFKTLDTAKYIKNSDSIGHLKFINSVDSLRGVKIKNLKK
ncbi:RHS repeat domain-containing protein, partial [Chryseobacterium lathyri]